ncbi:MAG: hypothetical protein U5K00_13480 [Melioribacteraceae bacterium]|nr:hypothetical protein [Melioribacteraceae bacterium]
MGSVEIKEPLADLNSYLLRDRFTCNLSKNNEAFGMVLIEAMSLGYRLLHQIWNV